MMPAGDASRMIEQPIPANLIAAAAAAFGQKLRGDTRLGDFDYGDIESLAGAQSYHWRQESIQLASLAASGHQSIWCRKSTESR